VAACKTLEARGFFMKLVTILFLWVVFTAWFALLAFLAGVVFDFYFKG
jgi:hypothetical protein